MIGHLLLMQNIRHAEWITNIIKHKEETYMQILMNEYDDEPLEYRYLYVYFLCLVFRIHTIDELY